MALRLLVKMVVNNRDAFRITFAGENSIVIVLGANESLTPEHVDSAVDVIESASVLLCQFEVPLEATLRALKLHRGHGAFIALFTPRIIIRCIHPSFAVPSYRKSQKRRGRTR